MKTILLNGSPKGNAGNSASYLLAKAFGEGMGQPREIHAIAKEDRQTLLSLLAQFDHIIVFLPNYIHAVPGDTLDFLYSLPVGDGSQSLGFVIQSGYPEGVESELASRLLANLTARLHYGYLGTVIKGECAGMAIMPERFTKLVKQFTEFGALYARTGRFDPQCCEKFASPYRISRMQTLLANAINPLGNYLGWGSILKKNNAYRQRRATPYLD